ncbi:MAG: penicillin-binding protein 2 [Firmicutes bacterium]|nr:penicillin-binding protein 2 [Bacillota bacterium]
MSHWGSNRLFLCRWLLIAAFLAIAGHLYVIQVLQGPAYAVQARQISAQEVVLEDYMRGEIVDRNGVPLSGGYHANRVAVFPGLMDDKEHTLRTLSGILDIRYDQLLQQAGGGAFLTSVPSAGAQQSVLRRNGLPGVFLLPVYQRYGPAPLAAHITGHLGKIESMEQLRRLRSENKKHYALGDWVGKSGLEYFYEGELKGQGPARAAYVTHDALGRIIKGPGLIVTNAGPDPARKNVKTTIDAQVQRVVEEVMDAHIFQGAVVVMRAGGGDILAMASRPGYHPSPARVEDCLRRPAGEIFLDRCTALFQPGSVFKVVLAAAALERESVFHQNTYNCAGSDAEPVHCWFEQGHGAINFADAFAHSCNPAFVQLGQELGPDTIVKYATGLGLDKQNIIGYPAQPEFKQDLSLVGKDYNLANSSIGQGPVLVTPVQVTAMMNAIVSGGTYHAPQLVAGLTDAENRMVYRIDAPEPLRALKPATADRLQEILRRVTASGVGKKAELPGWGTAGKTGSAEVAGPNDTVNAWFTGYAPADTPRFVITVLVQGGQSGSETAAPVFRTIVEKLMLL